MLASHVGRIVTAVCALLVLYYYCFFQRNDLTQNQSGAEGPSTSLQLSGIPTVQSDNEIQSEMQESLQDSSLSQRIPTAFTTLQTIILTSALPKEISQITAYKPQSTVPLPSTPGNNTLFGPSKTQPTVLLPSALEDSTPLGPSDLESVAPSTTLSQKVAPPEGYSLEPVQNPWCTEHFGMEYLQNLAQTSTQYCDIQESSSELTCFHSQTEAEGRIDTFCISSASNFNQKDMNFELDCTLTNLHSDQESKSKGIPLSSAKNAKPLSSATGEGGRVLPSPNIDEFAPYWTKTGPAVVIPEYFNFHAGKAQPTASDAKRDYLVIVKREGSVNNLWHSLMEVFSLTLTLDVLQMSHDKSRDRPFWTLEDMNNTQVMLLDDHPEGPNWDLWQIMAKKPILRAGSLPLDTVVERQNVIVPLQGSSNTLWQGDWEEHTCKDSRLLQAFRQRVLNFYGISTKHGLENQPIVITFLKRSGSRQLKNFEVYANELQEQFPYATMRMIEFEGMPLKQQIEIVQDTDILVGVHGAGLTHTMFLPPQSTVVEIEPPDIGYKGFRNMANLFNHQYFSTHGFLDDEKTVSGNWHFDHVRIPKDQFMYLMELAVKSQYNTDLRGIDVI